MKLTFYGAARTVTGSKYLLETNKHSLLVDCGIFQGEKALRKKNWEPPRFDHSKLSAIVLTHAHIDHTGYLPRLVREGYNGPVYCTPATKDFLKLLLVDSAYLQEEEAKFANKHKTSKHSPALPLYTQSDARRALKLLKTIPRDHASEILQGVTVTPYCAGHILGSTILNIDSGGKRVTFSGDIGRYHTPILPDPAPTPLGDLLLCESTYGDREHDDVDVENTLTKLLNAAFDRGGPVIIPAFALGRTQNLLYYIAKLEREGKIPVHPVFIDSPMAINATDIYLQYRHDYDEDAKEIIEQGFAPLRPDNISYCQSVSESKRLNSLEGPAIIISASGMVTGGRILHHMIRWLPEEKATVLFVGFQAHGTRGQIIESGADDVRIFGRDVPIRCNVVTLSGLSAHADRAELLRWLRSCSGTPKQVKVVHGENDVTEAFAKTVREELNWNASPADYRETVEV